MFGQDMHGNIASHYYSKSIASKVYIYAKINVNLLQLLYFFVSAAQNSEFWLSRFLWSS